MSRISVEDEEILRSKKFESKQQICGRNSDASTILRTDGLSAQGTLILIVTSYTASENRASLVHLPHQRNI
jgi:hypothetical protein